VFTHQLLLHSQEFVGFLESRSLDQSRLVRDLAGMASAESPGEVVVGIMAGRYLERLDLTEMHTEKTRKRIAGILQRFCVTFGGLNPHDVRTPLVSYWIRHQRWALDTQLWVAVIIERVWQFGMDIGCLGWNPIQGLRDDILGNGEKKESTQ
jgi:hypothetical protein